MSLEIKKQKQLTSAKKIIEYCFSTLDNPKVKDAPLSRKYLLLGLDIIHL